MVIQEYRCNVQPKAKHAPSNKESKLSHSTFDIDIRFLPTGELYPISGVYNDLSVHKLREMIEYATGIPVEIQVAIANHAGDLPLHTDIKHSDVVPQSKLILDVRSQWSSLIVAVCKNDEQKVLALGVHPDDSYGTPALQYMSPSERKSEKRKRALFALYIAAHRGNTSLCHALIDIAHYVTPETGTDVNGAITKGRHVLQIASSQGHGKIIDLLLHNGADIDAEDDSGETALSIAVKMNHKSSERHLFLYRWQQRARVTRPRIAIPRFAHQYFDSVNPVWLKGKRAQLYFAQVLPSAEFEGSHFSAPKRKIGPLTSNLGRRSRALCTEKPYNNWLTSKETEEARQRLIEKEKRDQLKQEKEDKKRLVEMQDKSYEQWLSSKEQQKVPSSTKKGATKDEKEQSTSASIIQQNTLHNGPLTMTDILDNIKRKRLLAREEQEESGFENSRSHSRNDSKRTQDLVTDDQWLTLSSTELYQKLKNCSLPNIFT